MNCYTFLYVPSTFLYVPPYKNNDCYQKLYVPIRSVQTPRNSCKSLYNLIRSYTFRANPSALLVNRHTFLYVPYTFRIRSPHKPSFYVQMLYVPTRPVQPIRKICEMGYGPIACEGLVQVLLASHSCPHVATLFPFLCVPLYVPIRSGRPPRISVYGHLGLMGLP